MGCCWFSREHVHTLSSLYLHLCTFCRPFRSMLLHLPQCMLIECCAYINIYNFQQRISWLSHRWRTQRNAISNVNCRIQWIIESLNAPCAPWYSEEHACLSVVVFSIRSVLSKTLNRNWMWRIIAGLYWSAPLKCISVNVYQAFSQCDNYLRCSCSDYINFMLQTVCISRQLLDIWPQIR
jgi:hypothetical protein